MNIPELVKIGWTFPHMWCSSLDRFCVNAEHYGWGLHKSFYGSWDVAHEKARAWAACEEAIVNGEPTGPDTLRAPAMEGAE